MGCERRGGHDWQPRDCEGCPAGGQRDLQFRETCDSDIPGRKLQWIRVEGGLDEAVRDTVPGKEGRLQAEVLVESVTAVAFGFAFALLDLLSHANRPTHRIRFSFCLNECCMRTFSSVSNLASTRLSSCPSEMIRLGRRI